MSMLSQAWYETTGTTMTFDVDNENSPALFNKYLDEIIATGGNKIELTLGSGVINADDIDVSGVGDISDTTTNITSLIDGGNSDIKHNDKKVIVVATNRRSATTIDPKLRSLFCPATSRSSRDIKAMCTKDGGGINDKTNGTSDDPTNTTDISALIDETPRKPNVVYDRYLHTGGYDSDMSTNSDAQSSNDDSTDD